MTATTKSLKQAPSGSSQREKGKTHASWPKSVTEPVKTPKNK